MNCCFSSKHESDFEIPPGETRVFTFDLEFRRPGPFAVVMPLFVDDNGVRELRMSVRGVVVAEEPRDAPPKP